MFVYRTFVILYIQAYRCHPEMSQFGFRSGIQPCMVCEELLQPAVRHRMSEQPFDCRKGACRHIGARIETLDNMLNDDELIDDINKLKG